jgi:hypothetical protein
MNKTKQNKRNRLLKRTRKYRKYYGGEGELDNSKSFKKSEGVLDIIGDKVSGYSSSIFDYGKKKGLRLLGLQEINPTQVTEKTEKMDETLNKATEDASKIGSDIVNVVDKSSAAIIENVNDILENPEVGKTASEAGADIAETSSQLLESFNEAVNSPEFKEETKVALDNAAEIASIAVKSADKPINEAIDVVSEAGTKALGATTSGLVKVATDALAAIPGAGAIIEIGKIVNDVSAAAGDVVEASTSATEAISKAVVETSNNINEGIDKLEEAKHKTENLVNMPSIPSVPKLNSQNLQKNIQTAGALKKISNEKYQVAGRISESINEFNNPIHFSIIKGGNGNANKTKKRLFKNKRKSKRVRFNL